MWRMKNLSAALYPAAVSAWYEAWLGFWEELSSVFNPRVQRERRAQERDYRDADLCDRAGGNFDCAGTGGQD